MTQLELTAQTQDAAKKSIAAREAARAFEKEAELRLTELRWASFAASDHHDRCTQAQGELRSLAQRFPDLFDDSRTPRPLFVPEDLQAKLDAPPEVKQSEAEPEPEASTEPEAAATIEPPTVALLQPTATAKKRAPKK